MDKPAKVVEMKYGALFALVGWMTLIILGFQYSIILGVVAVAVPILLLAFFAN